jgi:hypothetical protein
MQTLVRPVVFLVWMSIGASAVAGANAAARPGTSSPVEADAVTWKRVQRLDPGARVKITVGGTVVERYFVRADDNELIVLNLSAANLPKRQLLNMAVDNPAWVAGTSKTTYRDNNLRIGPEGVFVKDQKVAELAQVVERIPRDRVTLVARR